MTDIPKDSAVWMAASLSAPGCIQRCVTPAAAASRTTRSVMAGGVITEMAFAFTGSNPSEG